MKKTEIEHSVSNTIEKGRETRGEPIGSDRYNISDDDKSISNFESSDYYFRNLSGANTRYTFTPEEMEYRSDTEYMGENNDGYTDDDDNTLPTDEKKCDDVINQLGRALRSKFVSGIHR